MLLNAHSQGKSTSVHDLELCVQHSRAQETYIWSFSGMRPAVNFVMRLLSKCSTAARAITDELLDLGWLLGTELWHSHIVEVRIRRGLVDRRSCRRGELVLSAALLSLAPHSAHQIINSSSKLNAVRGIDGIIAADGLGGDIEVDDNRTLGRGMFIFSLVCRLDIFEREGSGVLFDLYRHVPDVFKSVRERVSQRECSWSGGRGLLKVGYEAVARILRGSQVREGTGAVRWLYSVGLQGSLIVSHL